MSNFFLEDYLTSSLQAADELYFSPSLAVPVAQDAMDNGTDVGDSAQATAFAGQHASGTVAAQRISDTHGGNWFTNTLHWFGQAAKIAAPAVPALLPVAAAATKTGQHVIDKYGGQIAAGALKQTLDITDPGAGIAASQVKPLIAGEEALAHTPTGQKVVSAMPGGQFYVDKYLPGAAKVADAASAGVDFNKIQQAPLDEVAHQYRYLRDVQARHGTAAFLTELLGTAAGATAGGFAGSAIGAPSSGAVLGGELATGILGRLTYQDSWERTKNGALYRDPHSGLPVNPGEDVARLVNLIPGVDLRRGTAPYSALADATGFLTTMATDPVARTLGIGHDLATQGRVLMSAADVDRLAATSPRAQMVFTDIAARDAGSIQKAYPQLSPLAKDLGEATSGKAVVQVLKDALDQAQMRGVALPSFPSQLGYHTELTADELAAQQDNTLNPAEMLARRVRTKVPLTLDDNLQFTNRKLDLTANDQQSYDTVRALLKYGRLNDRVVDGLVNDYINATDWGIRKQIVDNGLANSFLSQIPNPSPDLIAQVRQEVADSTGGIGGRRDELFAYNTKGESLSQVEHDGGAHMGAAVYTPQRGPISLPTFDDYRTAINAQRGALGLFGKLDDFASKYVMTPFRRLATFTGGFAQRIAAAELIPAVLREGAGDIATGTIAQRAAKLGYKLGADPEAELADIQAAVAKSLRGRAASAAGLSQDDVNLAIDNIISLQGHTVPPALSAGHFVSPFAAGQEEAAGQNLFKLGQQSPGPLRETATFKGYKPGDPDFPLYWQRALREVAQDPGMPEAAQAYTQAYLDAARNGGVSQEEAMRLATEAAVETQRRWVASLPPLEASSFARKSFASVQGTDPLEDWARVRVEGLKGLTHTPEMSAADLAATASTGMPVFTPSTSAPHLDLLNDIANGQHTPIAKLESIVHSQRPLFVKGRVTAPDMSGNLLSRIANGGHERVLGPIVNTVARENQYFLALKENYDPLRELLIDNGGYLSSDEALNIAQRKAVLDVARFVHNPYERTQFASFARNFVPFYFAQEQSYRRLGRLLEEDPAAFRRMQIAIVGMHNYVQHVQDQTGTQHVLLPGLGWLDEGFTSLAKKMGLPIVGGVPTQFLGSVNSLNTVLPFSEGQSPVGLPYPNWSPFVTIPAHVINSLDPLLSPTMEKVLGPSINYGNTWEMLVPNTWMRNLMNAVGPGSEYSTAYQSAMISTLQRLAFQEQESQRKWVESGHDLASYKNRFIPSSDAVNAASSETVARSSTAAKEWQDFVDRVKNQTRITMVAKALVSAVSPLAPSVQIGDTGLTDEFQQLVKAKGISIGTDEFLRKHPDALAYTIGKSDSSVQPIASAQQWAVDHLDFLKKFPNAAAYFIPQDLKGKYDPTVYNEQLAMGLRQRKDLRQFAQDFYVAAGNHQFFQNDYPAHQAAMAAAADNPDARAAETANWNAYLSNVASVANPTWWNDFQSKDRITQQRLALAELQHVFDSNQAPPGEQTDTIRGLLKDWNTHQAILAQGHADGWTQDERDAELTGWATYTKQLTQSDPWLNMVISRVFKDHTGA